MKVTLYAYISEYTLPYIRREDIGTDKLLTSVSWSTTRPAPERGTVVGQVEVDVEFLPVDQILPGVAEMLKAQIVEIRAKATKETTVLEGQIQQLLAIEHKEPK